MNNALFRNSNSSTIISVRDISSRKEYLDKYARNLFCPEPGCNAMLDYVELPFVGHEKIFRTHKGSNHRPDCPHQINHKYGNEPTFSSETFSQALSDGHIKSVLKGLFERNTSASIGAAPSRKRSVSKHHSKDATDTISGKAIPSIDPNAEPVKSGEREPSVRKKRSQDLFLEDHEKLRGVDGLITQGSIGKDYVELYFKSQGQLVSLLFYNSFRDKSNQSYQYVLELAKLLSTTDLHILVCCLGIIEILPNKIQIQIMSSDYITFEGLSIYSYMQLKAS